VVDAAGPVPRLWPDQEHVHRATGVTRHSLAIETPSRRRQLDRKANPLHLHQLVSHVIGVDTHKDSHSAAVLDARTGGVQGRDQVHTNLDGYEALVELADEHASAEDRAWAIEGTGSYGAGLTEFLTARGEWVIEIDRPTRPARRNGAKSDDLDAERAAREALSRQQWATPRARGAREAMRVLVTTRSGAVRDRSRATNQLKAMVVSAPDALRERLRAGTTKELVARCAALRDTPTRPIDHQATVAALRRLARRVNHLNDEIAAHDRDLAELTARHCPQLVAEYGIGTIVAAQAYISWSHPGRCRNEAAFANLAGTAPIDASSGQTVRRRLNRGGDRALNCALHSVILTRSRAHAPTRAYLERRRTDGKNPREARRCLKRYLARRIYRLLETGP
jgi:transposase